MSADTGHGWPPAEPRTCRGCGSKVTARFERVLGDNTDTVYACPDCEDRTNIQAGYTGGQR
jgi:predicted  nucleic acid-binding Zn-ribbon protein